MLRLPKISGSSIIYDVIHLIFENGLLNEIHFLITRNPDPYLNNPNH